MEEKKIELISHEQDEAKEEESNKQDENGGEILESKGKKEAEVGEKGIGVDSLKKPKQSLKPNPKAKVTVPKPFSLATDQRKTARERLASVDGKANAPTFTRSSSLINPKALHQVSNGGERNHMLRRAGSVRTMSQASTPRKVASKETTDTKVENGLKAKSTAQGSEIEKKKPQLDSKVKVETKKLTKSNTFKALSLPSFYKKKDPLPTTEAKKIQGKEAKPALLDKERKSVTSTGNKGGVSRSVTTTAKQTISKLLKTTRKNHTKPEEIITT